MIKIIYVLVLMFFVQEAIAQDAYKKRYFVKYTVEYDDESILTLQMKNGEIDSIIFEKASGRKGLKSNVAFGEKGESNILYVNPWLVKSEEGNYVDRDSIYFYELNNRRSVNIRFKQWSLNALSVPLKIRFGEDQTEFSTGINLGALLGHTWGKTNFLHRKGIGNKEYDSQHTFGAFLGANKLEFSFENEDGEDDDVTTASISIGLGYLYAYQKFTVGVTGGLDFGLGENSVEWDYQSRPWLGVAIGYSLFSF